MNTFSPWMTLATAHWHRPWATAHPAWRDDTMAGFGELARRLHYPAWCEQQGLAPTLTDIADTPGWRLLGLTTTRFDGAVCRAGLALLFAAHPRRRLVRQTGGNRELDTVRWALGRAPLVPGRVTQALRDAELAATPEAHAAVALWWCTADQPSLWARLRLRLAPTDLPHGGDPGRAAESDALTRAWLATLWAGSVRATCKEEAP